MKIKFTKMHGIGNDYVYINAMTQHIDDMSSLAIKLSDRHFSIGGDGVIYICHSDIADAKMRMFNADGSEGKMCGNGVRCVGKYIFDNGIVDKSKDTVTIETLSGIKTLKITVDEHGMADTLLVDMGKAVLNSSDIPVVIDDDNTAISKKLTVDGVDYNITCVSMGNPHCVIFGDDPDSIELEKIGPKFENNVVFPDGVNTEFVQVVDRNSLKMRVWERGSGETLACGTGACATTVAAVENGYCNKNEDITVHLKGGDLVIKYTDDAVYMTGTATTAFVGEVEI